MTAPEYPIKQSLHNSAGGPVHVKSSKQKLVTKSSTEAELVALSDYARQALCPLDAEFFASPGVRGWTGRHAPGQHERHGTYQAWCVVIRVLHVCVCAISLSI